MNNHNFDFQMNIQRPLSVAWNNTCGQNNTRILIHQKSLNDRSVFTSVISSITENQVSRENQHYWTGKSFWELSVRWCLEGHEFLEHWKPVVILAFYILFFFIFCRCHQNFLCRQKEAQLRPSCLFPQTSFPSKKTPWLSWRSFPSCSLSSFPFSFVTWNSFIFVGLKKRAEVFSLLSVIPIHWRKEMTLRLLRCTLVLPFDSRPPLRDILSLKREVVSHFWFLFKSHQQYPRKWLRYVTWRIETKMCRKREGKVMLPQKTLLEKEKVAEKKKKTQQLTKDERFLLTVIS